MDRDIRAYLKSIEKYVLGSSVYELMDCLHKLGNIDELMVDKSFEDNTLFRGIYFEERGEFELFIRMLSEGIYHEDRVTSWTMDNGVAMDFMYGAGYKFYNKDKKRDLDGFGVILSYQPETIEVLSSYELVRELASNCEEFKSLVCMMNNEEEYLLKPGKYKVEVSHATQNCEGFIAKFKDSSSDIFKWVQYVDDFYDVI